MAMSNNQMVYMNDLNITDWWFQSLNKQKSLEIGRSSQLTPLGLQSSQDVVGLDLNSVSDKWKVLETKARVARG